MPPLISSSHPFGFGLLVSKPAPRAFLRLVESRWDSSGA
jgi:hypothetical protein